MTVHQIYMAGAIEKYIRLAFKFKFEIAVNFTNRYF